jgi:hypothetical protein
MWMELRELVVRCGRRLGGGSGLRWDSDAMEGQGMVGDTTFHDLDRDMARVGTWCDEDGDVKAWQDEDKNRQARNWR